MGKVLQEEELSFSRRPVEGREAEDSQERGGYSIFSSAHQGVLLVLGAPKMEVQMYIVSYVPVVLTVTSISMQPQRVTWIVFTGHGTFNGWG